MCFYCCFCFDVSVGNGGGGVDDDNDDDDYNCPIYIITFVVTCIIIRTFSNKMSLDLFKKV